MAKAYIFLADGCEETEALTPVDLFRRAGINVSTVSIMGSQTIEGAHKIKFKVDQLFMDTNFDDGNVFMLPGGMPGTKNLADYSPLIQLLKDKNNDGKRLAAICAAPALVLGEHNFLEGKKAVCYPGMEDRMLGAEVHTEPVLTDGNITTSRGAGTAIAYSLELIRLLKDDETADEIRKSIVY
jgi:4-methyl-5(b-hydroxyethyl)-thiazole monophosphate biosynthesis